MDELDKLEDAEIMAKPSLNPEAPAQLGYPKELCINLIDNFFKSQLNDYITNVTKAVESNDH
jgi:hypothetical protein